MISSDGMSGYIKGMVSELYSSKVVYPNIKKHIKAVSECRVMKVMKEALCVGLVFLYCFSNALSRLLFLSTDESRSIQNRYAVLKQCKYNK